MREESDVNDDTHRTSIKRSKEPPHCKHTHRDERVSVFISLSLSEMMMMMMMMLCCVVVLLLCSGSALQPLF